VTGNTGIHRAQESALNKLISYLEDSAPVSAAAQTDIFLLIIYRVNLSDVKVFITDTYVLGEADVHEALSRYPDVHAIVNISIWNHNTSEAREYCRQRGVALFTFKELLGAIHYAGADFLDYQAPKQRRE